MLEEKLKNIVCSVLMEFSGLFLVDIIVKGNHGNLKLIILIDSESFFDIDQCAQISRKVGHILETEEVIEDKYTLEVSSPGVDMPLKLEKQYIKNIGRILKVELLDGNLIEGKLESVNAEDINLSTDGKKLTVINFKEIVKANVIVSFK